MKQGRGSKAIFVWAMAFTVLHGAAGCAVDSSDSVGAGGATVSNEAHVADVVVLPVNATPCIKPSDCPGGFCVDGVCCNSACSGVCQACTAAKRGNGVDGTCGAIASGLDPDNECSGTCNGFGACSKSSILLGLGGSCALNSECASGFCVDGVCCNASCTGTCQACTAALKGSGADGTCDNIAPNTDPQNECAAGDCNGFGACGAPPGASPNGSACSSGMTCLSGYCVDGVCCDTACNGVCHACTASKKGSGLNGTCGNIANATDPDNECFAGNCNGAGACAGAILLGNGNACASNAQCVSGFCADGYCCNSACSGNCQACDISGSQGVCSNACAGQCSLGFPNAPAEDAIATIYGSLLALDAADFDNDGIQDIVVARASFNPSTVEVIRGTGNGGYSPPLSMQALQYPQAIVVADLNADGKKDIIVGYNGAGGAGVYINQGNFSFAPRVDYTMAAVGTPTYNPTYNQADLLKVADVNGDGKLDLATANTGSNTVSLRYGLGNGAFANKIDLAFPMAPKALAFADFNGDAIIDMAVTTYDSATSADRVSVKMGQGAGAFGAAVHYAVGKDATSMTSADLNGDGKMDLVTTSHTATNQNKVNVLLNQGNGTFATAIDYDVQGNSRVVAADLTGDSVLDLVVVGQKATAEVLVGQGNGTFFLAGTYALRGKGYGVVAVDIDQDGDKDLVTSAEFSVDRFLNAGAGDFGTEIGSTPSIPMATRLIRSGDINGDGFVDLVGIGAGAVEVALGQSNGGLGPVNSLVGPAAVADARLADMNSDGKLDLVYTPNGIVVRLNQGNGTFGPEIQTPTSNAISKIVTADYDGDGKLDVSYTYMWAHYPTHTGDDTIEYMSLAIWKGNGDGTLTWTNGMILHSRMNFGVSLRYIPLTAGDFNGDGRPDFAVTDRDITGINTYYNQGNLQFSGAVQFLSTFGSSELYTVDVNGDSFADLLATYDSYPPKSLAVFPSTGTGFVQGVELAGPVPVLDPVTTDVDGDGQKDLVYVSGNSHSVGVFLNPGGGAYGPRSDYAVGFLPTSMAAGDWNHDGKMDFAVQNSSPANVTLLYNTCLP